MNIDFNSFFRLRVDIHSIYNKQYQLIIEQVDLEDEFYSSKIEYFLSKDQLKQLVDYFNEAYDDIN